MLEVSRKSVYICIHEELTVYVFKQATLKCTVKYFLTFFNNPLVQVLKKKI